jgi:hypothetical protein
MSASFASRDRVEFMNRCWIVMAVAFFAIRAAEAEGLSVQVTWRLLDCMAVDYAGAVAGREAF